MPKLTRRDALRGLLGGAAAVAVEPVRRIWQVGAKLELPSVYLTSTSFTGVDYFGDGNFDGGCAYGASVNLLHPHQRAALAAETGRWDLARQRDLIISDEAHRLPPGAFRRAHEEMEQSMWWESLPTQPGFRNKRTGEIIDYPEACKRGLVRERPEPGFTRAANTLFQDQAAALEPGNYTAVMQSADYAEDGSVRASCVVFPCAPLPPRRYSYNYRQVAGRAKRKVG